MQIGEEAYKSFSKQRLESSPPERKFHDTITKQKLKTFSDPNKKFKAQQRGSKEVVLRADRNLFAHMIVFALSSWTSALVIGKLRWITQKNKQVSPG